MTKRIISIVVLAFTMLCGNAYAALELELTQGINGAIPIAIVPFAGQPQSDTSLANVTNTIQTDLKHSGRFNLLAATQMQQFPHSPTEVNYAQWQGKGVDAMVVGNVESIGSDRYRVSFAVMDVLKGANNQQNPVLVRDQFEISGKQLRQGAHHISDVIYQQLTGEKGIFSTKIAYVLVQRFVNQPAKHLLEVADVDGVNPRPLLVSAEPIMSPAWSPDGKSVAYVSFENRRANIYLQDVASGKRNLLSSFPGINGAPVWSPDGKRLAFVLSKSGAPNIYTYDLAAKALRQVTNNVGIDTEPSWAPDGQSLVFSSNRSSGLQVYQLSLASGAVKRLTYNGKYNASANFTPDGKNIVLLHGDGSHYNVAVQNIGSGALTGLTHSGNASSPSVAPNGSMVLYAINEGAQGELGMVSIDGRIHLRLPAPNGTVQSPAWSPFKNW